MYKNAIKVIILALPILFLLAGFDIILFTPDVVTTTTKTVVSHSNETGYVFLIIGSVIMFVLGMSTLD